MLKTKTLLKILGFGFVMFTIAILYIAIMLPFEADVKVRTMNAEMISILISPLLTIVGAMLGLYKGARNNE